MVKNSGKNQAFSLIELSIVVLIIGILIAGVTQGSRLVTQSRIKVAQNATQSSPINSIPDLALWLETTLDNSITSAVNGQSPENGDPVSAWNDINPQGISKLNAVQATSVNQPQYIKNGIAGLPSLSFNGSASFLSITPPPILQGNKGYTIIAVWQTNTLSGQQIIVAQDSYIGGCSGGGTYAGLALFSGTAGFWFCGSDWNSPYNATIKTSYIETMVVNNNITNNLSFYLNRLQPTRASFLGPSILNFNFTIGNGAGGGLGASNVYFFNGYISEIIIFNRSLKASEVTDIQNYLSTKYSITLS